MRSGLNGKDVQLATEFLVRERIRSRSKTMKDGGGYYNRAARRSGGNRKFAGTKSQFTFSNEPDAVGLFCATGECWRCPRTKADCGHDCHKRA